MNSAVVLTGFESVLLQGGADAYLHAVGDLQEGVLPGDDGHDFLHGFRWGILFPLIRLMANSNYTSTCNKLYFVMQQTILPRATNYYFHDRYEHGRVDVST